MGPQIGSQYQHPSSNQQMGHSGQGQVGSQYQGHQQMGHPSQGQMSSQGPEGHQYSQMHMGPPIPQFHQNQCQNYHSQNYQNQDFRNSSQKSSHSRPIQNDDCASDS